MRIDVHVVVSRGGERTIEHEIGLNAFDGIAAGVTHHAIDDVGACIASGSFRTDGMIVAPCSMRTLAAIASHRLTADWGARMLATDHSLYDPLHYNMGAVWPFVTGFVAWGHYRYERPWAAFPLVDALARLTFDFARGRHPELLSGAFYRPLDTAVPHQFFATSMFVTPLMRGLPPEVQDSLGKATPFPSRLGRPEEYAALVEHIAGNLMLNGEVIRLDGAVRLTAK